MDSFSKIRESGEREEQKRQMINKAIDLLHKLANKRVDYDEAKSEISRVVSEYYVIEEDSIADHAKINLEVMINNSFDILLGIQEERLNLYQAIMLINKVMAHKETIEKEVKIQETENIKSPKTFKRNDGKREKEEKEEKVEVKKHDLFSIRINNVIENRKKLNQSIEELNEELKSYGFTLNALEPK